MPFQSELGRIQSLYPSWVEMVQSASDTEASYASTRAEYDLLVTGLAKLLTVLVPQLDRLGARLSSASD